jgi:hypothetical protein
MQQFKSASAVISLQKWTEQVGVVLCTVWRWRKKGWLTNINITGWQYLTQAAIKGLHRRAVAGDFSQIPVVPERH